MAKKYTEKVCCCIPTRLGVFMMSLMIFAIYLAVTTLLFVYRNTLKIWSTLEQNVDTPLTESAFNGIFYTFVSLFIIYMLVSIFGMISIIKQQRKMVRIYHILNWFFVLLLLTITVACWIYFKVNQDTYINDCQDLRNMNANSTLNPIYTPIQVPGKMIIAGGTDKNYCIDLIRRLVIGSGICVFACNFIQLYWARSIGVYATYLKRHFQHKRLQVEDDDDYEDLVSAKRDYK
ncbi:hypothetical protein BDF20DRAFT_819404 [Mycotypha africana]|uniref:uncharacterized protein n=1 Tax=Mycotypha africana TaxID=64632 RepID=UPI0023006815|nr:uncharacterized protein BDF20DRAFT_819404 [Mycotypha africana]KAI8979594.1 hypothetical protein BDF20DRAFT_819404 [Mycotypha africana]